MTASIYLIRHGETVWNRKGRLQGQLDAPLTRLGVRQSIAVGRELKQRLGGADYNFLCSPLDRTRQTASLIAEELGHVHHEITYDDRLLEITLGDWDGYPGWDILAKDYPEEAEIRNSDPWNYRYPNGESSELVRQRIWPLLSEIKAAGGTWVIVSHGVAIKIARGIYLGLTEEETFALDRPQGAFHHLSDGQINVIEAEVDAV